MDALFRRTSTSPCKSSWWEEGKPNFALSSAASVAILQETPEPFLLCFAKTSSFFRVNKASTAFRLLCQGRLLTSDGRLPW